MTPDSASRLRAPVFHTLHYIKELMLNPAPHNVCMDGVPVRLGKIDNNLVLIAFWDFGQFGVRELKAVARDCWTLLWSNVNFRITKHGHFGQRRNGLLFGRTIRKVCVRHTNHIS